MRRLFLLFMVMTFILVGCAGTPKEDPVDSSNDTTNVNMSPDDTTDVNVSPDDADFGFSYKIVSENIKRGERVRIFVELTNQQSVSYAWEGPYSAFRAAVALVCVSGESRFSISPEPVADTDDFGAYEIATGEKRSANYYFNIPTDAPLGSYSLICSFAGTEYEFKDVFELDQ